jgi:hypothetical protein
MKSLGLSVPVVVGPWHSGMWVSKPTGEERENQEKGHLV